MALSYVWGDITKTAPINLDDAEIQITTNLLAALRRMCAWALDNEIGLSGFYLWIDALCIDQSNLQEKNNQVSLMRSIYQEASFVTMWLGEEQDDSRLAMSSIETWGKAFSAAQRTPDDRSRVAAALATVHEPFDGSSWKAIRKFLHRPYWTRIWIVQEVALAQRALLVCGESTLESVYFWSAVGCWESIIQPDMPPLTAEQRINIINSRTLSSLTLMVFQKQQTSPAHKLVTPFCFTTPGVSLWNIPPLSFRPSR